MPELLACRACLACKVPVYNILRTRYKQAFERMAAISMADRIKPHALCAPCLEILDKCCRLQEKCAISEGILNRLLHQNQLTEDAIAAVDRQQHNLVDTLPTFTLETMRPSKVEKSEGIKHKTCSNTEPWEAQKLKGPTDNATLNANSGKKNILENATDEAVLRIGLNKTQSFEDLKHVVVKTEPDKTTENPTNNIMAWIEAPKMQCLEYPKMVKIEPRVTQSSEVTGKEEPSTSHFIKEPLNQSNHTISIETVKLEETPYIQIDAGKLLGNVKSEVDESLVEIDEMNQPIHAEFSQISDDKDIIKIIPASRLKKVPVIYEANKSKIPKENPTNKLHRCIKCHYQTPHIRRLAYHMKKHSGFVICAVCGYQCATKSRLVCHLRVHTKERPYKCKECNKAFTEPCSLTKHMNSHKGVKPYTCLWCEYKAASKNHLDRHIKRHIGDKRFKCELCDYACVQKCDLTRHAKTHENARCRLFNRVAPVIIKTVSIAKE